MAANYWTSSQYKRWTVDRSTLHQARTLDRQYVDGREFFDYCSIFFANAISKLCKKLNVRQRVVATAIILFKRFYLKNSYCETDPLFVAAACCYVASKAEESPVHIKTVTQDARNLFTRDQYGCKTFPSDSSKLAEMEFFLMDELECDLTIFHPYRTLLSLCCKTNGQQIAGVEAEAGEYGVVTEESGGHLWGASGGRLELDEAVIQHAWFIINDTYRSDIVLIHPPHLIAIAALFLALSQNPSTKPLLQVETAATAVPSVSSAVPASAATSRTSFQRQSSRSSTNMSMDVDSEPSSKPQSQSHDIIGFLAGLNISMSAVTNVIQDIIAFYVLWAKYKDDDSHPTGVPTFMGGSARGVFPIPVAGGLSGLTPMGAPIGGFMAAHRGSPLNNAGPSSPMKRSTPGTPMTPPVLSTIPTMPKDGSIMTAPFLVYVLTRMRETRFMEVSAQMQMQAHATTPTSAHAQLMQQHQAGMGTMHGAGMAMAMSMPANMNRWTGMAVNKRLERTQQLG